MERDLYQTSVEEFNNRIDLTLKTENDITRIRVLHLSDNREYVGHLYKGDTNFFLYPNPKFENVEKFMRGWISHGHFCFKIDNYYWIARDIPKDRKILTDINDSGSKRCLS